MRTRPALGAPALLIAGAAAAGAMPSLPTAVQQGALLVVGLLAGLAVLAGILRHRPRRRWPWLLLVTATLAAEISITVSLILGNAPGRPFPRADDALFLLVYLLLIVGMASIPGPGRHANRVTDLVDAGVVACTAGVLSWTLLVADFTHQQQMSTPALLVALAYPLLDLFLATVTVRMVIWYGRRSPAHLILVLGAVAVLVADIGYLRAADPTGPGQVNPVSMVCWLLAYVCLAAAATHPSMAHIGSPRGAHRFTGRGRIAQYALLVGVGPAVTATALLRQRADGVLKPLDILVPLTLTTLVGVLLVVRSGQLATMAQRRAADLDVRTVELEAALDRQEALQRQLAHRALHDALTGLPNRVLLRERLDGVIARGGQHALLMLDLDGFKDVNDTHGHPVGDELLRMAAARLDGVLARTDTLARLGGDEFAVLLEDLTSEQADAVAVRVLNVIREPFTAAGHRLHVSASIGLLELTGTRSEEDAFRDADLALYAAKEAGKNRIVTFHDGLRADHLHRTQLVRKLRHALDHGELDLHFQPVVDLRTRAVVAAEALLRWFPPDAEPIRPDQFIPVAESSGLILPIGSWVLRRACELARPWWDSHGVRVSVNVSAEQLRDASFPGEVEAALAASGLSARALMLEVTESVLISPTNGDATRAVANLTAVRALGVQVALDDFGTGYSSLAYLRDLPVDSLKIDRAFVPTADTPQHTQLARAIVDLGASMQLVTVAEGVETADQANRLTALACDFGQGYYFARPLPAIEFGMLLHDAGSRLQLPAGPSQGALAVGMIGSPVG